MLASTHTPSSVFATFVGRFQAVGDPERALQQQAYMKSAMPLFGVGAPEVARICRDVLEPWPFDSIADWREAVLELWHRATHRELRHAALALLEHKEARFYQGLRRTARGAVPEGSEALATEMLELCGELITTGAWWDLVDPLASRRLGALLLEHNVLTTEVMLVWSRDSDIWLRRAAIISQLKLGDATDRKLLIQTIEPALDAPEFWLRKSIGWALRQYARVEPAWVRSTVGALGPRLSPLSRREALKHLG